MEEITALIRMEFRGRSEPFENYGINAKGQGTFRRFADLGSKVSRGKWAGPGKIGAVAV